MRARRRVRIAAFLFCASAPAHAEGIFSKIDQPLYVVTQNHYAESAVPGGLKFQDVLAVPVFTPAGKKLPAPNAKVPLFSLGKPAGELTVRKQVTVECEGTGLVVTLPKGFGFSLAGFALATAAKLPPQRETGLRKLKGAEGKELLALAKKRFADKAEFGSHDPAGKTEVVDAVFTRAGKDLELVIGTVKSTGAKELDTLFVIARLSKGKLVPELVVPGTSVDLEDAQDLDFHTYAEQLDFDGDGVDELLIENRAYESKDFSFWKRRNGKWESAGTGGESGC